MCGIAGQISADPNKIAANYPAYCRMQKSLARRGPDQRGIYLHGHAALIHARLAVVDLENGCQPMVLDQGGEKYILVYNGELYNTPEFYDDVDTLTAQVDVEFIQQQYGTASIGYLIFLPVEGASYSILHYLEDGGNYLNEFSCLYLYDSYAGEKTYNSPTVYAHEILHLFGAADLYVGSRDAFVTQPLAQYVLNTWPDAIMYYTYNSDNGISYEHIEKTLCPLTAYRLGLVDSFPGSEQFPAATQDPPGVFSNGAGQNWTASDEAT